MLSVRAVDHNFRLLIFAVHGNQKFYHNPSSPTPREVKSWYNTLEVEEGSDSEVCRRAFIQLCKRYHPDSSDSEASSLKFNQLQNAYNSLQKWLREQKEREEEEKKVYDIKHTAPQHRQYLNYEGIGSGTVAQRERQYRAHRAERANEKVLQHRMRIMAEQEEEALVVMDKAKAKEHKLSFAYERMVEDLIQESMARGEFSNLPGEGKPLRHQPHNPYIDSITQKLNQVLIDQGFHPEWVLLEREIREEAEKVKSKLLEQRKRLSTLPLDPLEEDHWMKCIASLEEDAKELNKKIDKYNFIVPIKNKQKFKFRLKNEAEKILKEGIARNPNTPSSIKPSTGSGADKGSKTDLLDLLQRVFG